MKNQRSKTKGPKRRHAPKAARRRGSAAAGGGSEIARLTRERDEALEQQKATGEILGVISRSPGDLPPVFDAIVQSAARLCDASNASLLRVEGSTLRHVANYGGVSVYKPGEARKDRRFLLDGGGQQVNTQPGEFTEFRIVLPRGAASIAKAGESA